MKRALIISLLLLSVTPYTVSAKENFFIGENFNSWGSTSNSDSIWSLNDIPSESDDVVFDYQKCKKRSMDKTAFSIIFWREDNPATEINSLSIRNFYDPLSKKFIHGIFRTMEHNQKLKIRENFNRESSQFDRTFQFGVSSFSAEDGARQMEIEIGGDLNVGTKSNPPDYKAVLFFGGNGDETQNAYGGPKKVTVKGFVNIYGASELNLNVGTSNKDINVTSPDFIAENSIRLFAKDGWYPMLILNTRRTLGLNKTLPLVCVVQTTGLSGNGIIRNGNEKIGGFTTLKLNPPKDKIFEFKGRIQDDTNIGKISKIKIILDGEGTQILTKTMGEKRITGGIEINSGTLVLSAQKSIGDIVINNGNLVIYEGGIESGVVDFICADNLTFNGGKITLNLYEESISQMIKILGDIKATKPILIEFNSKLAKLSKNYKIIDWNKKPNCKFQTNTIQGYKPVLEAKDDGLYVTFNQSKLSQK